MFLPRPPAVFAEHYQLMFAIEEAREEGKGKGRRTGSAYPYKKIGKT